MSARSPSGRFLGPLAGRGGGVSYDGKNGVDDVDDSLTEEDGKDEAEGVHILVHQDSPSLGIPVVFPDTVLFLTELLVHRGLWHGWTLFRLYGNAGFLGVLFGKYPVGCVHGFTDVLTLAVRDFVIHRLPETVPKHARK